MSDDLSLGVNVPQTSVYTPTSNDSKPVSVQSKVIDNEWTDDSISSLFVSNGIDGKPLVFSNLPNSPKLPKPDQKLTESVKQETFSYKTNPEMENFIKDLENYPSEAVLNKAYDQAFEKIIKDLPNADQLRFAHYTSSPDTPKTKEEMEALTKVAQEFGITTGDFNPTPVKSDFEDKANLTYDDEFSQTLENQKPPLSDETKAKLKFLHFNQDANFPGSQALKGKLAGLEKEAALAAAKKLGMPLGPDGNPPLNFESNSSMYNAGLNGFYQEHVDDAVKEFFNSNPMKPDGTPWSSADKQLLQKFINDPSTPAPEFIAKVGAEIRAQAIQQVVSEMHLEGVGFTPAITGTYPTLNPMIKGSLDELKDILKEGLAVNGGIPPDGPSGPMKAALFDILKEISKALSAYKQSLYEGQGATTEQAQAWAKAKLDINLNQIAENAKKAKEAASKEDKISKMGIFGKIFKFIIMLILLIVNACMLNPVGMAVAIMGMIDAVDPDYQVFTKVMKGIENLVAKLMPYLSPDQLKVFSNIAKFMFILQAGPVMMLSSPELITSSHIIRDIAMASGKSKEEAESIEQMAVMIGTMAVTLIAAVVVTILTAGVAGLAMFPNITSKFPAIASAAESLSKFGAQMGGRAAQMAEAAFTMTNDAASMVQGGLQMGQSFIKKDLAMLKGIMKAEKEKSDADIANIQKMIKKLLALLQADVAAISYVTTVQNHILSSASQTATAINSSAA